MGLVHGWMDDVVGVGGEREKTNQRAHGGEPRRVEHVFNLNNHPVPKHTSNRIPPTKRHHSTHDGKAPISTQRHGFAKQQREREKGNRDDFQRSSCVLDNIHNAVNPNHFGHIIVISICRTPGTVRSKDILIIIRSNYFELFQTSSRRGYCEIAT